MNRRAHDALFILLERGLPWLVLSTLLLFTYAFLFQAPYSGFHWEPNGRVRIIYVSVTPGDPLRVDDTLVQIGPLQWNDYQSDLSQVPFRDARQGQTVPIVIERDGQRLTVSWVFPGLTLAEFIQRVVNVWPMAYAFWLAGTITSLFARPKDKYWRLLVAFNFLTALWLLLGTMSSWRIWGSAILFRVALWLSIPVYLHLHWIFPQPLGRVPGGARPVVYTAAITLALAQSFQWLRPSYYFVGFSLAIGGSFLLLVAHFIFRPKERRQVGFVLAAGAMALLFPAVAGLSAVLTGTVTTAAAGSFLSMPLLPAAYLYAVYRRQLGNLELRANRIISIYLFLLVLSAAIVVGVAAADAALNFPGQTVVVAFTAGLIAAIVSVAIFEPFQRLVERYLLGIKLPPRQMIETYAARVIVSLDFDSLIHLLKDEIAPSLLIRQSALFRLDGTELTPLYAQGLEPDQIPTDSSSLLIEAGRYRRPEVSAYHSWVRLILPLSIEHKPIGLWLLGRRDPDDYYPQQEIATLQSLANQTAVAVSNIEQADRLRALYQNDIDQREIERRNLARELHDNVLQHLAALNLLANKKETAQKFEEAHEALADSIRHIISDLRPPVLNYGLDLALKGLADTLSEGAGDNSGPAISVELVGGGVRYDMLIEQHLYRIVQHAYANALQHARAQTIRILGRLEPERVEITVEDDGLGFPLGNQPDLSRFMAYRHFGLAGMTERAALIKADIQIDSAPGRGTKVRVYWSPLRQ